MTQKNEGCELCSFESENATSEVQKLAWVPACAGMTVN